MENVKWTNLFINIALFFVTVAFISSVGVQIGVFSGRIENSGIMLFFLSVGTGLLIAIIYHLKKIVKQIMKKDIFNIDNVKRFNIIAYILYILAVLVCFIGNNNVGMQLIAIDDIFAIKFDTIILLVLGSLSSVIAYTFYEAIKIREESEELKEENKYTI